MPPLLVPLPGNEAAARRLADALGAETGALDVRRFPDGESYLRFRCEPAGRAVALVCTLDRPDDKILPLLFAAAAARDLGAARVGLVAPYLAYMRQDRRFKPGEAVTSVQFAALLSAAFDWLATVDPHLHRHGSLADIYTIPAVAVQAAPAISAWLRAEVVRPLLIGPDSESEQWVGAVARDAGAAHTVLDKVRHGDRDVTVSVPELGRWAGRTPVLIDDIVSTGRTMIAAIAHLAAAGTPPPVCVAVHGIFAGDAHAALAAAGAGRVVTTNTVAHDSNAIDITGPLAAAVARLAE